MEEVQVERRLAAILVADIAGYSRLMAEDEAATVTAIKGHQAVVLPMVEAHGGRIQDTAGDGILAEFRSVLQAVECAMAIHSAFAMYNQEHPTHPMQVRIGINAGEPILTEGRLFGTAVHMAFRICARAQPGQILISDVVHRLVAGKDFTFADRGRVALKGFPGRLRLYEVQWQGRRA